jgi:hypothetical protein
MPLHSGEFSENPLKKAPLHIESQNNIVPKPNEGKLSFPKKFPHSKQI